MNKLVARLLGRTRVSMALGVFIAMLAVAFANGATKSTTVRDGNLVATFSADFSPLTLPKSSPRVPIALTAKSTIRSLAPTHVPPLKKMLIMVDKNIAIDVSGYPVCRSSQLGPPPTVAEMRSLCGEAVIGEGKTTIGIEILEQPISVDSDLLVLNGGARGGTTKLFIYAYIDVPVPASIVAAVEIKGIHSGRYGTSGPWRFRRSPPARARSNRSACASARNPPTRARKSTC